MGEQENQEEEQLQQDEVPTESTFMSTVRKIGRFLAGAFITFIVICVLGLAGMIGYRYLTDDHSLAGEVSYQYMEDASGFYLIVDNNDPTSWDDPTITVNGKYKFRSQDLAANTRYNFDLTKFFGDGGERFLPQDMVPMKVKIESGWDSAEWNFR